MSGNPSAIERACKEIESGAVNIARRIISTEYPFVPLHNAGRAYSEYHKTLIFLRDGFIDRYHSCFKRRSR